MAELCRKCFIEIWKPSQDDIDNIVMSEDNDICECCMECGPYVDHIGYKKDSDWYEMIEECIGELLAADKINLSDISYLRDVFNKYPLMTKSIMKSMSANDLISRSEVTANLMHQPQLTKSVVRRVLIQTPSVNPESLRLKGRWVVFGQRIYGSGSGRNYTHYCSECGQHGFDDYVFCPNCGVKMEE